MTDILQNTSAPPSPAALDGAFPARSDAGAAGRHTLPERRYLTLEHLLWLLVLAAAAGLRLMSLGGLPLGQAEGARALQTSEAALGRTASLWPGGVVDAVTALIFKVFGGGDAGARVAPAVAGLGLVASLWLLRAWLGRGATLLVAVLVALSPVCVAAARTSGGQSLGAALTVVLVCLLLQFLADPHPRVLSLIAAVLGVGLAADAVFVGGVLILSVWLAIWLFVSDEDEWQPAWHGVRRYGEWLPSAMPLLLAGLLLAVSRFGLGFERLRPAALSEWAFAFAPARLGVPWHYAVDVLAGYELPLICVAAVGVYVVVRDRSWHRQPLHGLLLVWLALGAVLTLAMASRAPSTLLLVVVPMALLGAYGCSRLLVALQRGRCEQIDVLIGCCLLASLGFSLITAGHSITLRGLGSKPEIVFGVILACICLGGAKYRWWQDGPATSAPTAAALAVASCIFALHSVASVGFDTGDELLSGQRTTREGVALARLLVANGGGVSSVTDDALPTLAWYLRTTVRSGGSGRARLVTPATQLPAGYHLASEAAVISRAWASASLDPSRIVRWWVFREAWGDVHDVGAQLVVED